MKNKTKVLQVFASLDMGGAESRMMDVYRYIDKNNVEFDFVSLQQNTQFYEKEISELGGRVFKLHSPRQVGVFKHINELRKVMRDGNYNAIHAHTSYHCGMVMLAAWLEKIPVRISHARTNGSIQKGLKTRLFIGLGKFLINRFSTDKLAISKESGLFLFGKKSFCVVPNAIDIKKYQIVDKTILEKTAKELGIKTSDFIIGHIGRFDEFKNQRFAIDVIEVLKKEIQNVKLVLVGDGELKPELQKCAEIKGLKNEVFFTGVREDVPVLINLFNVVIFPSIVEGLGGVILEAQAAGVPSVVSNTVPDEVDLNLGLVKKCSLQEPLTCWCKEIKQASMIKSIDMSMIKRQFDKYGYTIEVTADKYLNIYEG